MCCPPATSNKERLEFPVLAGQRESRMTILLVEDTDDDVFFFNRAWQKAGGPGRLVALPNGKDLLDYLSREGKFSDPQLFPWPDIVFLDLKMPMVSGFDVLKWVRQQNFTTPFQVVVLSGSSQEEDIHMATELGAADYLVKPIDQDDLKRRLLALQE